MTDINAASAPTEAVRSTAAGDVGVAARDGSSTLRAFRHRDCRIFAGGQVCSAAGTFMQGVAQAWLVLDLTASGTSLGLVLMLQSLPVLLLASWGGWLADRFERRKVYLVSQALGAAQAVVTGLLVLTGHASLAVVGVLAVTLGVITAVDQPARHSIVVDLVPQEDLGNAIALNMSLQSAARIVGPALAGLIIATAGVDACFFVNAASFVPAIVACLIIRSTYRRTSDRGGERRGSVLDGIRYVARTRNVRILLISAAIIFMFAWEYDISVPLLARYAFSGDAWTLGLLLAAQGIGAVAGGLYAARRGNPGGHDLQWAGAAYAASMLAAAVVPALALEVTTMALVGATGIIVAAFMSTRLQMLVPEEVRGRITALWIIAAVGTRPLGAPLIGWAGEQLGPRWAIGIGGIAVLAVLPAWLYLAWQTRRTARARTEPRLSAD
jgi:MFS family permease